MIIYDLLVSLWFVFENDLILLLLKLKLLFCSVKVLLWFNGLFMSWCSVRLMVFCLELSWYICCVVVMSLLLILMLVCDIILLYIFMCMNVLFVNWFV